MLCGDDSSCLADAETVAFLVVNAPHAAVNCLLGVHVTAGLWVIYEWRFPGRC